MFKHTIVSAIRLTLRDRLSSRLMKLYVYVVDLAEGTD